MNVAQGALKTVAQQCPGGDCGRGVVCRDIVFFNGYCIKPQTRVAVTGTAFRPLAPQPQNRPVRFMIKRRPQWR